MLIICWNICKKRQCWNLVKYWMVGAGNPTAPLARTASYADFSRGRFGYQRVDVAIILEALDADAFLNDQPGYQHLSVAEDTPAVPAGQGQALTLREWSTWGVYADKLYVLYWRGGAPVRDVVTLTDANQVMKAKSQRHTADRIPISFQITHSGPRGRASSVNVGGFHAPAPDRPEMITTIISEYVQYVVPQAEYDIDLWLGDFNTRRENNFGEVSLVSPPGLRTSFNEHGTLTQPYDKVLARNPVVRAGRWIGDGHASDQFVCDNLSNFRVNYSDHFPIYVEIA